MIYLIHFSEPLAHAQHYVGFVDGGQNSLDARLNAHKCGAGAKILAECNRRGIHYEVVKTMPGDRTDERRIKNGHNTPRMCSICSQTKNKKNG